MGERQIGVVDVRDRWLSPGHRYFRVVGTDKALYILRHDTVLDQWEMTFFKDAAG